MIFFIQFVSSMFLEYIIFYLGLKLLLKNFDWKKLFFIVLGLNIVTQPLFTFVFSLISWKFILYLVISEVFIFLIEGFLLYKIYFQKYKKNGVFWYLVISFFANFISWQFTPFFTYMVSRWI